MRTPAGTECPYFYGDYFRGRNVEVTEELTADHGSASIGAPNAQAFGP